MTTPTREAAWQLLSEWTRSESLRKHALAVEAAVRGYARAFGEDEEAWGVVALLHDLDYERFPTPADHPFRGCEELRRLGVPWVSLAPRFVGRFEKGVDYQGDLAALQADLAAHAAIARALGPYKLSLHSGSDKFSVYPLIAAATGGLVHLKTAGTSYLEALRVVAGIAPDCFRQIAALARERYAEDRQTYHVSARLDRMPDPARLSDHALPALLDQFDARQILHVTFGAALASFGAELRALLATHRERYAEALERHFVRHLQPFITDAPVAPPPGP